MPSLQCWLYCSVLKEEQRGSCRLGHRVVMVFVTVFVFVSVYVFVFVFEHSAGGPCRVVQQAVMVVLVCRSAKVAPSAIVREHLYRAAHTPSPPPRHCCPSFLDQLVLTSTLFLPPQTPPLQMETCAQRSYIVGFLGPPSLLRD